MKQNGNYKDINDYINNITDQDYQKMICLMRENNPSMANMMENI